MGPRSPRSNLRDEFVPSARRPSPCESEASNSNAPPAARSEDFWARVQKKQSMAKNPPPSGSAPYASSQIGGEFAPQRMEPEARRNATPQRTPRSERSSAALTPRAAASRRSQCDSESQFDGNGYGAKREGRRASSLPRSMADDASEVGSGASDPRFAYYEGCMDGRAGKATVDINALKSLKASMARKKASSSVTSGSQIYDEENGFGGNYSVPRSSMSRSNSAPSLAGKEEVEGSRPRQWKPSKAPRCPPGGSQTFHPAKDGTPDEVAGRKRFPEMGPGSNRDPNADEALRFFKETERLGKHSCPQLQSTANKHSRDTHRYYLAAEGKPEQTPGKARSASGRADGQKLRERDPRLPDSSTSAGSSDAFLPSECDSLPLGAEWSSCRIGSFR